MRRITLALAMPTIAATFVLAPPATAQIAPAESSPRLRPFAPADGDGGWRLDDAELALLRDAGSTAILEQVPVGGDRHVDVELRRFSVTGPQTQFVLGRRGGEDLPLDFDASDIDLFRGTVLDRPGSHVFLALRGSQVHGTIDLGAGDGQTVLSNMSGAAGLTIAEGGGALGPPLGVEVCGLGPAPLGPPPIGAPPAAIPGPGGKRILLAVETDYEYYELFGNADDAAAYVTILYASISDLYIRDARAFFHLTFVRLWDDPADLFNEPDPLSPLRSYWELNMGAVERNVTQLLTGRRNLPYGGVAWLSALCSDYGYSVAGYILGSFTDAASPSFGNWDLVVCAHELGHNCGAQHTHDYGIDACAFGAEQRGTIMSYCHTNPGGNANIDMRFHTDIQAIVQGFLGGLACLAIDCNADGVEDIFGQSNDDTDDNGNGVLDVCEDCNGNGVSDGDEIASGQALDIDGNGLPDECDPDCNGNSIPDAMDIAQGTSADLYGDGVPDECEADCNGNGTSDYVEIQLDMSLDVDRDVVLDACQDCNANLVNDFDEIAGGLNLWAGGDGSASIREFHGTSGVLVKESDAVALATQDVIISPQGTILASSGLSNSIVEIDPATGAAIGTFVSAGSGGLLVPAGMAFGADGALYVASRSTNSILKYDGETGAFIETFAGGGGFGQPGSGVPMSPFGLAFGSDGNLFATTSEGVREYDAATGDHVQLLVASGSGGLNDPRGLAFTDDGRLLVASLGSDAVLEFDGSSGAFIRQFDQGGLDSGFWALSQPWCIRIGPDGRVYVSSHSGNAAIHTYQGQTGQFLRSYYVLAAELASPTGFDLTAPSPLDCNLNLRPDDCDIADGFSSDANGNGIPDECDGFVPCPADVADGNGVVDVTDLIAMLAAWGTASPTFDIAPPGGDGSVGVQDLLLLIASWGACSSP